MNERNDQNPTTGQQSDISKSQSTQQPSGQRTEESGENRRPESGSEGGQTSTGESAGYADSEQRGYGNAGSGSEQGDTLSKQRSDIEGSSLGSQPTGTGSSGTSSSEPGFVGSEGNADTSNKLVEDEKFGKDGQGAPEGK